MATTPLPDDWTPRVGEVCWFLSDSSLTAGPVRVTGPNENGPLEQPLYPFEYLNDPEANARLNGLLRAYIDELSPMT